MSDAARVPATGPVFFVSSRLLYSLHTLALLLLTVYLGTGVVSLVGIAVQRETKPVHRLLLCAGAVVAAAVLRRAWRSFAQLRRVRVDDRMLHVSSFGRQVEVPLDQVVGVTWSFWHTNRAEIRVRLPTALGTRFKFLPRTGLLRGLRPGSAGVAELESRIARVNGRQLPWALAPRDLSSREVTRITRVEPVIGVAALAVVAVAVPALNPDVPLAFRWILTAACAAASAILLWMCGTAKHVRADDEALIVSNLRREIRVPFADIEDVKTTWRQGYGRAPMVEVRLHRPCAFGRRIHFVPALCGRPWLWEPDPTVLELRERVERARSGRPPCEPPPDP